MGTDDPEQSGASFGTDVGEVPASTGGVVDLDRVIGNIPAALVFLTDPAGLGSRRVMEGLGERLVDFGHERIQLLGVAPVSQADTMEAEEDVAGHVRMLADENREIARRFGVTYVDGSVITVLIGADGLEAARWEDLPAESLGNELLRRIDELVL